MNLVLKSLKLDFEFLKLDLTLGEKIIFIWQKYFSFFRDLIFGLKLGKSYAKIFGTEYFLDDKFGVTVLQMMYVDNAFLKKIIPQASVVVDIGANIGQFNFFSKYFLKAKKIYSFEPIKSSYHILKLNSEGNIYNYAVSNQKKMQFYIPIESSYASIFPTKDSNQTETIRGIKLDQVAELKKEQVVDLLKIDVEGAEYEVIQVSKAVLKKTRFILIEINVERGAVPCRFIETIKLLKEILPGIKLVKMSRIYKNRQNDIVAVDFLFQNILPNGSLHKGLSN